MSLCRSAACLPACLLPLSKLLWGPAASLARNSANLQQLSEKMQMDVLLLLHKVLVATMITHTCPYWDNSLACSPGRGSQLAILRQRYDLQEGGGCSQRFIALRFLSSFLMLFFPVREEGER